MLPLAAALLMTAPATFYDFTMDTIDGKHIPLKEYKGKVVLVINVASKCGFTPQYAGLEKLYTEYKDKSFTILGFPANDFKAQEPGTNAEIAEFCSKTYGVNFPMFAKISVKGTDMHPLYKWLIENGPRKDDIEWNFTKFLLDKSGKIAYRFMPNVTPESKEFRAAIDELLK